MLLRTKAWHTEKVLDIIMFQSSRRRVIGNVAMGAKPGARTVLTAQEDDLPKYLVSMVDRLWLVS